MTAGAPTLPIGRTGHTPLFPVPRLGPSQPPASPRQAQQTAPATSGRPPQTSPLSGYMDFHYNRPGDGAPPVLDFHRFVLLMTHRFTDRIRFVAELELEHGFVAGLEEGGELELEQAYLDFFAHPMLNFRAGMVLAPVGIINERHEPPIFHGVERPFVDTVIIPTTWFDVGAGIHGDFGNGVRYRAYAMAPLDTTAFTAEEGLRGASQHGNEAQVRDIATTGRVEYVGTRGLQVGASFWRGNTSFALPRIENNVGVYEADVRFSRDRLETRAQYAHVFLSGAGAVNDAMTRLTGVDPHVAEELRGFYVEGAYRILPSRVAHDAALFVRYENFDTQFKMPAGSTKLPQFDRDAWITGVTWWVDPDVALKVDYTRVRSQSSVIPSTGTFNAGIGWWF